MADTREDTHACAKCPGGGPRCEYHYCGKPATCHVWQPRWRTPERPPAAKGTIKFMCDGCYQNYHAAMTRPMKGIDRPAGPDGEDWKGSILEHISHAQIALAFEERAAREKEAAELLASDLRRDGDEKFTPAQLRSMFAWRAGLRRMRLEGDARG